MCLNKRKAYEQLRQICALASAEERMRDGGCLRVSVDQDVFNALSDRRTVWGNVENLVVSTKSREVLNSLFAAAPSYGYKSVEISSLTRPYNVPDKEASRFMLLRKLDVHNEEQLALFLAPELLDLSVRGLRVPAALDEDVFPNLISLRVTCVANPDAEAVFARCLCKPRLVHLEILGARVGTRDDDLREVVPTVTSVAVSVSLTGFCKAFYEAMAHVPVLSFSGLAPNRGTLHALHQPHDMLSTLTHTTHLAMRDFSDSWPVSRMGPIAIYEALRESEPPPRLQSLDIYFLPSFFSDAFLEQMPFVDELTLRTVNWTRVTIERAARFAKTRVLTFGGSGLGELPIHAFDDNEFVERIEFAPECDASIVARKSATKFNSRTVDATKRFRATLAPTTAPDQLTPSP